MTITPVVITLDEPIDIVVGENKTTYTELTFARKLKGKDLVAMDRIQGELLKSFAMFASMADVPITVFYEMDTDVFARLALEVAPLMGERGKGAVAALKKAKEASS